MVVLEPSTKRGTNGTSAPVSLYWLSCRFHSKQPPNQISQKSTKVDRIRLFGPWKHSDAITKSYTLQHIKTIFPQTTRATNAHDWGYEWGRHRQDKTEPKPLARGNVRPYLALGKFLAFPSVIKKMEFSLSKCYQHQGMEVK